MSAKHNHPMPVCRWLIEFLSETGARQLKHNTSEITGTFNDALAHADELECEIPGEVIRLAIIKIGPNPKAK